MLVRNLKLSWADVKKIHIKDIADDAGRRFAAEISDEPRHVTVDAYICSDGRNRGVRQILKQLPNINEMNTAGNVVYNPSERPTVIIAHGNSRRENCGAVDHARACQSGGRTKYRAIRELVGCDPIKNALAQLMKVPEKYRAGIIYFNHAECRVEYDQELNRGFPRRAYAETLYEELGHTMENLYTEADKAAMAKEQNPEIILLSNVHFHYTYTSVFRVDLQRDLFHPIVSDSLLYALDHALAGEGSFRDSRNFFLVFRKNRKLPAGLEEFLEQGANIAGYIKRGGRAYIVTVGDLPSDKTVFAVCPR